MQRSPTRTSLPQLKDRLPLGQSGLSVSPICLGITKRQTVPAAFAAGINFFFISNDLHWVLYSELMAGIADLLASGVPRDDIVIAGASYLSEPLFGYLQFNELLSAVPGLERIDILIAGAAETENFLPRYERLVLAKKHRLWGCRAIGASFHNRSAARMAICSDLLDIAYIRYNSMHPGAESDLFPHINSDRACLMYNFKSTSGDMTESDFQRLNLGPRYKRPKVTDGYRFAFSRPEMDGLLVAPQSPAHIDALVSALAQGPLPASRVEYMKNLWLLATGQAEVERS
jgi:aryl-alcohol dehydrogenase-like predicted oxidoreductase